MLQRLLLIFVSLLLCGLIDRSFGQTTTLPPKAFDGLRPEYPKEARDRHLTGSGIVRMQIDSKTGVVTSAEMEKSTGHKILDDAAIRAFVGSRLKPGKFSVVRAPITFTLPPQPPLRDRGTAPALYGPRPEYPMEARRLKQTGSGIFALNIDFETGAVVSVDTLKSTGHLKLDNAAIDACKKWRFRPRAFHRVRMPITFTLRGVSYYPLFPPSTPSSSTSNTESGFSPRQ